MIRQIIGNPIQPVEEPCLRHRLVLQVRNGKLADAEIPVGMPRPLDIKIVAPIEAESYALALKFVYDGPVVDSPDLDPASVAFVVKTRPFPLNRLDIDRPDAQ